MSDTLADENLRKVQEDLKKLSDFNQKILDTSPCSIITIDKNGILTYVNKYFYNVI